MRNQIINQTYDAERTHVADTIGEIVWGREGARA